MRLEGRARLAVAQKPPKRNEQPHVCHRLQLMPVGWVSNASMLGEAWVPVPKTVIFCYIFLWVICLGVGHG